MTNLLIFGVLIGLDNLAVLTGFGLLGLRRPCRPRLVAAFVVCEAGMLLLGLAIGAGLREVMLDSVAWLGPGCLGLCGLLVLGGAWRGFEISRVAENGAALLLLPLLLSFDNLAAGLGFGVLEVSLLPAALLLCGISAGMCLLGLFVGQTIRHVLLPKTANVLCGLYLTALAVITCFWDIA